MQSAPAIGKTPLSRRWFIAAAAVEGLFLANASFDTAPTTVHMQDYLGKFANGVLEAGWLWSLIN